MADVFVIRGEEDLWSLLARALSTEMASPPPEYVRVQGWRPELLYFPDAPVGHVITPSLVRSISGFHNSLSRSYAYVVYGKSNARRLHGDDLDALDLNILVRDGSNGFQIVEEALDRLTREILAKMTGRQVTIGFVLFLLLYFSESVLKDWIAEAYKAREHTAEIAERLKLSEEETARIRLVTQALSANPNLKPMAVIADDGHAALLKGAATADRAVVLGTEVTKEEAQTVTAPREQVAEGRRIDGTFEVAEIDVDNPEGFMGTLRDPKTQQEFRVSINLGELPAEDRRALFDALESKAAVDALVNGWFVGGKLDSASIVRATKRAPPTPPGGGEPGTQSLPSIAQRKQP